MTEVKLEKNLVKNQTFDFERATTFDGPSLAIKFYSLILFF